jgi:hypothetical protein
MFLLFGLSWWFWGLLIIEFCLLTWFVEQEWPLQSAISIIAFIVLIWWLADIPVWTWLKDNPWKLLLYFGYYIGIGLGWSMGKYFFVLKKLRTYIKGAKQAWENKDTPKESFKEFLQARYSRRPTDFETTTKKLVFWALFWPTSFVWTMLNDPIRKLVKFLVHDIFIGVYRTMYNAMVGNMLKDFEKEEIKKEESQTK